MSHKSINLRLVELVLPGDNRQRGGSERLADLRRPRSGLPSRELQRLLVASVEHGCSGGRADNPDPADARSVGEAAAQGQACCAGRQRRREHAHAHAPLSKLFHAALFAEGAPARVTIRDL